MVRLLNSLGATAIGALEQAGRVATLFAQAALWLFRPPLRLRLIFKQMEAIGVNSLPVVIITATFTGGVLALQTFAGFKRFNAESLVGAVVALSMTRELGPVLTALIVAGRAGSAIAAELGTMRVTEQIDALDSLATNPVQYLIVPRVLAGLIMLPLLSLTADALGVLGGWLVGTKLLGINPNLYVRSTFDILDINDIMSGLTKAAFFGTIIAHIGCYCGFYTGGGAEGVGRATTRSVVISSMAILIGDYFLSALLFSK
ncbi:MAG: ABC transporter permease [Candidatus Schekmanbacteria bacterium]|nr:ABC transporter permease [Candidatus Schekmanbacteria bacterium]